VPVKPDAAGDEAAGGLTAHEPAFQHEQKRRPIGAPLFFAAMHGLRRGARRG